MMPQIDKIFDFPKLSKLYQNTLVKDVLSFWLKYGMDYENGGIYTGLDRDGSIIETDKSIWFQGRALWSFCKAYTTLKNKGEIHEEYLTAAHSLVQFIENYATDKTDGRMYFRVTFDGKPVIKRLRYFYSETFVIIGYAAYSIATNKKEYAIKAFELYKHIEKIKKTEGLLIPKFNSETSSSRGFGAPMILLNTLSELRQALPEQTEYCNLQMSELLKEIEKYFVRPEINCVLEQCNLDGTIQHNHIEGRLLNPGHAIEGSWFIMKEGLLNNDKHLIEMGLKMFDWMWERGWDKEYDGIIYFRDVDNKPCSEYWHDMKFWWPQCEAIIASLYAFKITRSDKYKNCFILAHNYFHKYFPDNEFGEYYGYFHRDGRLSTQLKGNMYKGPFHIPRLYIEVMELLSNIS